MSASGKGLWGQLGVEDKSPSDQECCSNETTAAFFPVTVLGHILLVFFAGGAIMNLQDYIRMDQVSLLNESLQHLHSHESSKQVVDLGFVLNEEDFIAYFSA